MMEQVEPNRVMPSMEMAEPDRMKLRKLITEPMFMKSIVERLDLNMKFP
jgi:hypothetical protein